MKRFRLRLGALLWLVTGVAAALLATAGVASQERQRPAPEAAGEPAKTAPRPKAGPGATPDLSANQALAREQLALIDQALAALRQLARDGRVSPADPSISRWGRRKLGALRKSGAGKAEIVAALEEHIKSLKEQEAIAKGMKESARGSPLAVYDAQFERMEAEIWLNEEKAR